MSDEMDASLEKLRHLHGQCARTQLQIQDLQEEQCKLSLEFEHQLEQHAQADCRRLADMMRTKLPSELRELIYQYLYFEDAPIPVGSYHFTTYVPEPLRSEGTNIAHDEPFIVIPEGATRQDHSVERDENIVYPDSRLLNPAYIGHHIAREASMYYYKANTFSVCTLENALSDFLFKDPIHNFTGQKRIPQSAEPLGLTPVDHIRNLQIRIKYEHYSTYLTFYDNLDDGEKNLVQGIFDVLHDFCSHLNPAIASQLHVEFCMMTAYKAPSDEELYHDDRQHLNLLEAIRVPVYILKHDFGVDITVIHYDELVSVFPRNVTAIFQLSKDQWSQEKQAYKAVDMSYSPSQYYADMRGNSKHSVTYFKECRWGLFSVFDKECKTPIMESEVWPIRQDFLTSDPNGRINAA